MEFIIIVLQGYAHYMAHIVLLFKINYIVRIGVIGQEFKINVLCMHFYVHYIVFIEHEFTMNLYVMPFMHIITLLMNLELVKNYI